MNKRSLIICFLGLSINILAQDLDLSTPKGTFKNPILQGGYPDPSICKAEDTFYIVNSSFEYFPGLPIHKSKDLINWDLVGYGLHRIDQCNDKVNLVDVNSDGGIHAPTIRYHNKMFYIISTNVYFNEDTKTTDFVNFIITAENPEGPWSEPHVLEGAPGIDPDIFFDDDGRVWYVGTHNPENPRFSGEGEIWLQEIDLQNWKLTGERSYLWRGACGGVWVEGPHLYKKDNRYYLIVAEGGTGYNHAVMIAVSDVITGPYISNDRNPILTTRHLSYDNWVHSTGHADLIELDDGRWYAVALGIRGDEERASNMGRETHLVPVKWEREPFWWKETKYEWPVVAPTTGRVERITSVPFEGTSQERNLFFYDTFDAPDLKLQWNFRRVPLNNLYSLEASKGNLRLFLQPQVIKERGRANLIGFRQTESDFEYSAKMNFLPKNNTSEAGISLFQKDDNYFTFTITKLGNKNNIQLKLAEPNKAVEILMSRNVPNFNGEITFKVKSEHNSYSFYYALNDKDFKLLDTTKSNLILSKKYTGSYLGVYASSNGKKTNEYADFYWVKYKGFERN